MNYQEAIEKLKNSQLSPGDLSEIRMTLSAEYATRSEDLAQILVQKAQEWLVEREKRKSDKSTDQWWNASPGGKQEVLLRFRLKGLEKVISAIKTRLEVMMGESRSSY